jgi:hypothetical protein
MKPSAYISEGGVIFKESPPDSILKLNPLYTSAEIQALHNLVKEQPIVKEQTMRELTDEEIDDVWVETCSDFKLIENGETRGVVNIYAVSRAILKKAREK